MDSSNSPTIDKTINYFWKAWVISKTVNERGEAVDYSTTYYYEVEWLFFYLLRYTNYTGGDLVSGFFLDIFQNFYIHNDYVFFNFSLIGNIIFPSQVKKYIVAILWFQNSCHKFYTDGSEGGNSESHPVLKFYFLTLPTVNKSTCLTW